MEERSPASFSTGNQGPETNNRLPFEEPSCLFVQVHIITSVGICAGSTVRAARALIQMADRDSANKDPGAVFCLIERPLGLL